MKRKQTNLISIFVFVLFLVACQPSPSGPIEIVEPVDVVIVGAKWEYLAIVISCLPFPGEDHEAGCGLSIDGIGDYPDTVSILNEFGENGWEAFHVNPLDAYSFEVEFLLKRIKQ